VTDDDRDLTCQELTEVLVDYLEGVMPPEDVARFEAHLAVCDGCAIYVEQMRKTISTVHALRPDEVEATVPDDLLTAFRAWKRGEPLPGT
jgi:anti-sigma factor RsiW